jgi:hypothetical protein
MTVSFEYDADPKNYGTDDPEAMAAADLANVELNGAAEMVEYHESMRGDATVTIEPVDGAQ